MKQRSDDAVYLVTANDLFSGGTVYHTGSGWSTGLEDAAHLATSEEAVDAAGRLNVSDAGLIVGAYVMALDRHGHPTANREARRLIGPGNYQNGHPDPGHSDHRHPGHGRADSSTPADIRDSHVSLSGI